MAKSKSGSGSIVKSVESMLPKGISLMHLVLAVVLGLMICSFMSDSVVEGQVNQGFECDHTGQNSAQLCKAGLTCMHQGGDSYSCEDPNAKPVLIGLGGACTTGADCASNLCTNDACVAAPAKQTCKEAAPSCDKGFTISGATCKGTPCTPTEKLAKNSTCCVKGNGQDNSGQDNSGPVVPAGPFHMLTKIDQDKLKGICSPKSSDAGPAVVTFCDNYKDNDLGKCTNNDQCEWLDCGSSSDTWDTSVYLKGKDHHHLVKCLGKRSDVPSDDELSKQWLTDSHRLPILDANDKAKGKADSKVKQKLDRIKNARDNNFLDKVGCTYKGISTNQVDCSQSMLPGGVKTKVQELADKCAKGWNQTDIKDLYKINGWSAEGGPIMSFDPEHGLSCKNPFYDSREIQVSEPRLIMDTTCAGTNGQGKCPCKSDADLAFKEKNPNLFEQGKRLVNNWTVSPRCNNHKFKDNAAYLDCLPTHASVFMSDNINNLVEQVAGPLSTAGKCT